LIMSPWQLEIIRRYLKSVGNDLYELNIIYNIAI